MVKKDPILASSPDIPNDVELQGDVNILEMAPPGHLSQDEDNGEVQKKLEVKV
jgi:hypothetical protein